MDREAAKLAGIFIVFFMMGLVLGNPVVLGMSLVPLFTLLIGLLIRPPGSVEVQGEVNKASGWVGEVDTL